LYALVWGFILCGAPRMNGRTGRANSTKGASERRARQSDATRKRRRAIAVERDGERDGERDE